MPNGQYTRDSENPTTRFLPFVARLTGPLKRGISPPAAVYFAAGGVRRNMIQTVDLFLPLQTELVRLLRSLSAEDWQKPTVAGAWRVKDVATHILDGDLRRLSIHRDGNAPAPVGAAQPAYDDLLAFLNDLNAAWVHATARLSPRMLTDLLEWAAPQLADFFASLAPDSEAIFPVAWAGESRSTNWMDIGRDYTEKWHHQAQIRDAVGREPLLDRAFAHPMLALSVLALPHAFRAVAAEPGAALNLTIDGDAGGRWALVAEDGQWRLAEGTHRRPTASARLDADSAWRLFYNGLTADQARARVECEGDPTLGEAFLAVRSVMV